MVLWKRLKCALHICVIISEKKNSTWLNVQEHYHSRYRIGMQADQSARLLLLCSASEDC